MIHTQGRRPGRFFPFPNYNTLNPVPGSIKVRTDQVVHACITHYLPHEKTEIAGYYYYILKRIAWEGINIVEILSTTNEFSIILDETDVDRAFAVLKKKA